MTERRHYLSQEKSPHRDDSVGETNPIEGNDGSKT